MIAHSEYVDGQLFIWLNGKLTYKRWDRHAYSVLFYDSWGFANMTERLTPAMLEQMRCEIIRLRAAASNAYAAYQLALQIQIAAEDKLYKLMLKDREASTCQLKSDAATK